jgi:hypothetical protein
MDPKVATFAVAGLLITLVLAFFDFYLAGIVLIIILTLCMSIFIMHDSRDLPDISAEFRTDAKAVILKNTGNAAAVSIHVSLVPLNIEFDIPTLAVDTQFEYTLPAMVAEIKVLFTYKNGKGDAFAKSVELNALKAPYDPLKPMLPLFRWK